MTRSEPAESWPQRIVKLALIQQHIRDLDKEGRYKYHLPRVPASDAEIAAVERHLRHPLDAQYKDFLKHGNGWPGFLQWTDLFGTPELTDAKRMRSARAELQALEERGELGAQRVTAKELLPIALTSTEFDPPPKGQRDVFAIATPSSRRAGQIFWFAGELVDQFPDFTEFFLAMLDYNREVFQRLSDEVKPA